MTSCEHDRTTDSGEATEGAVQTKIPSISSDYSTQNLGYSAHTIGAPRADAQHHLGAHNAAYKNSEQMPVLSPCHEDVPQADQIELHDQGVETGYVVELLALGAGASGLVQDIALVIRNTKTGVAAASQITGVAGELRAGIKFRSGEDDAGHEPGGRDFAQENYEDGSQLPDAKVAYNIGDDIATGWCWRWRRYSLVHVILHLIGEDVGGSGFSTSGGRWIDHGFYLVKHSANEHPIYLFALFLSCQYPSIPIEVN